MRKHSRGVDVVEEYKKRNEAYITDEERRIIVNIMVSHLIEGSGSPGTKNFYPTTEQKDKAAEAIIVAFPCLAIPGRDGLPSHAHFFSRKTSNGYIDQKLKAEREALLSPLKRKRASSSLKGKKVEKKRADGVCKRQLIEPGAIYNEEVCKHKVSPRSCYVIDSD